MKVLVAVKRVIDPYTKVRVKADESGVETQHVKMAMNPFDEIAIEQAVRFKEAGNACEVVAVSIGSASSAETLRHALALGACRAILVKSDAAYFSIDVAKILQKIVEQEQPDLVFMGKQTIDGDNNQTPQMLAARLNWPQALNASNITFENDALLVEREIDGGMETLRVTLPAVVSTDLRLNEPRYASLPNIMKAKQKKIEEIDVDGLGISFQPRANIVSVKAPPVRKGGIKVDSVDELLSKLKHEAKVL